jgi:hypothetical protein
VRGDRLELNLCFSDQLHAAFCRLKGDVDSHLIIELLKQRKVWAQCTDVCGTFYYPKRRDALNSKPAKSAAPRSEKHAEKMDPHLASGAKVVTSALAVLPPKSEWGPIQAVREKHDKAFERWPPHINLYGDPSFVASLSVSRQKKQLLPLRAPLRV